MKKTWLYILGGSLGALALYAIVVGLTRVVGRRNRKKIRFIWL